MILPFTGGPRSSIRNRVACATLITVALVLIVSTLLLYRLSHRLLHESISRQQYTMVSELAGQMENRIQLANQQLSILSASITPESLTNKALLANILHHAGPAQALFDAGFLVISPDGHVIAEEMGYPEIVSMNLGFRDYFSQALKSGKPLISKPFRLAIPPHTPLIAFAYPVRDISDRIICLLVGYHSLADGQFLTSFSSERLGNNAYLYILSGRTILMHSDASRIMETIEAGRNSGIDRVQDGFEGSMENVNSRGVVLLSSYKKIKGTDWVMSANIPYDDAFRSMGALSLRALLVVLAGIVVSSLVVWYVTSRLTRPVTALIKHIDQSRDDNTEWQPLNLATGDELEQLSQAYDRVMGEVQQARQALKEDKDFFGSIIQNAATPMFILDTSHKIIFWNNALAKMTGKSSFQMVGTRQQWQAFYPAKRPVMADLIIDNANHAQVDMFYKTNSDSAFTSGALRAEGWYEFVGKRYYLFFEAAPIRNRKNEIVAAVETLEDITERRLLEESLSRLTRAVDQSPAAIVMTDADGKIEYVNPKFCQITGYSFEEAIGHNSQILTSGELDEEAFKALWNTLAAGMEWRGEFQNKRKDGTLYWEFASISPLFDKEGKINGYLAVKEDITGRKTAEAELIKSQHDLEVNHQKLEQLFLLVSQGKREWEETLDHLHDFIILTDCDHRVRRYNKLLADSTGKTSDRLIGVDWRDLLGDAGFTFISFNGKTGELHQKNRCRVYDLNVYDIFNDDGTVEGQVVSLNDTTELRTITAELEKAYAELKEAQMQIFQQEKLASIGQLAAGVAHEINNPMGFINSNLGSLDKYIGRISEYLRLIDESGTMSTEITEERKRLKIDRIMDDSHQLIAESQDGAARVRRIVQDLKSFSRVDQTERAMLNLNDALDTTINIAWNEIKYVATLNREYGDIPEILCYPQQLNQVFLNLLVNAAHALGTTQGTIIVRTWQDEETVCISVSDSGCGIAEENLTKIFDPFFTTKEVGKGTGLGLSISFDIIKKHGGEIVVESEVGRGTTFTVRLPIQWSATNE